MWTVPFTHDYNLFSAAGYDPGSEPNKVTADPLFVNAGAANFALQASSPAINAANPTERGGVCRVRGEIWIQHQEGLRRHGTPSRNAVGYRRIRIYLRRIPGSANSEPSVEHPGALIGISVAATKFYTPEFYTELVEFFENNPFFIHTKDGLGGLVGFNENSSSLEEKERSNELKIVILYPRNRLSRRHNS